MSEVKERVQVKVIFGFQVTHVSEEGELVTETYESGQEAELDQDLAREEEHRNRVRIIRPETPAPAEITESKEVSPEIQADS
ncbi:MAG: hypothetical protein ACJ8AK_03055 [Gemmatimonadaceae bacterium]